jgi:hypothetical protein
MIKTDGKLKLNLFGINKEEYKEMSKDEIKAVVKKALSYYPLGEIFGIGEINLLNNHSDFMHEYQLTDFVAKSIRELGSDCGAIIKRNGSFSRADISKEIIYCDLNTIEIAHELGHILGLEHHYSTCCQRENQQACPHVGEIMCGYKKDGRLMIFSEENIRRLKRWIK